jgi:hypothetical protein
VPRLGKKISIPHGLLCHRQSAVRGEGRRRCGRRKPLTSEVLRGGLERRHKRGIDGAARESEEEQDKVVRRMEVQRARQQ